MSLAEREGFSLILIKLFKINKLIKPAVFVCVTLLCMDSTAAESYRLGSNEAIISTNYRSRSRPGTDATC